MVLGNTNWLQTGLLVGDDFTILGPADTDAPGGWARVVKAQPADIARFGETVALKVLRDEFCQNPKQHAMFAREARRLDGLAGSGRVVHLLGCGFLAGPSSQSADRNRSEGKLHTDLDDFEICCRTSHEHSLRPFLVLEHLGYNDSLLAQLLRLGPGVGLPLWEALQVAVQGSALLATCHTQKPAICYIDHKLEHVIFFPEAEEASCVRFIDWNHYLDTSTPTDDVQNFACCVLHPLLSGYKIDGKPVRRHDGNVTRVEPRRQGGNNINGVPIPETGAEDRGGRVADYLEGRLLYIMGKAEFPERRCAYQSAAEFEKDLVNYREGWIAAICPARLEKFRAFWTEVRQVALLASTQRKPEIEQLRDELRSLICAEECPYMYEDPCPHRDLCPHRQWCPADGEEKGPEWGRQARWKEWHRLETFLKRM